MKLYKIWRGVSMDSKELEIRTFHPQVCPNCGEDETELNQYVYHGDKYSNAYMSCEKCGIDYQMSFKILSKKFKKPKEKEDIIVLK